MSEQKPRFYFLVTILAVALILAFLVLRPFLYVLILAAVFAVVLQPVHQWLAERLQQKRGLAALIVLLLAFIFIFTPIIFIGVQIFQDARDLYVSLLQGSGRTEVINLFNDLSAVLQKFFPVQVDLAANADQYLQSGLGWVLQHLGSLFSDFAAFVASSLIFFICLYYLMKDGQKIRSSILAFSPLTDADDEAVLKKLGGAVRSVVKGNLLTASIQGVLSAFGFYLFGVPDVVLWGSVAAIAALIPVVGTSLVLIPMVVFLAIHGGPSAALGLLLWGSLAVGLVDNFLGPKLVGRGMRLHPLIVLLSVMGGISFFGPIGFLLGPLAISLLLALADVYFSLARNHRHPL